MRKLKDAEAAAGWRMGVWLDLGEPEISGAIARRRSFGALDATRYEVVRSRLPRTAGGRTGQRQPAAARRGAARPKPIADHGVK